MKRQLLTATFLILAGALVVGAVLRQQDLTQLRAQEEQLANKTVGQEKDPVPSVAPTAPAPSESTRRELMRLRNEVSQLMERKRSLNTIPAEAERLQKQIAERATNTANMLPPGYIRKRDAQWVGMNTPENTLQSFLWASKNRDRTALRRLVAPESAQRLDTDDLSVLPGAQLLGKETLPDGTIVFDMEIIPGESAEKIGFRQINGEWRIVL